MEFIEAEEGPRFEAMECAGGFPRSFMETYSAFANTAGGTIALGVRVGGDGRL